MTSKANSKRRYIIGFILDHKHYYTAREIERLTGYKIPARNIGKLLQGQTAVKSRLIKHETNKRIGTQTGTKEYKLK